MMYRRISVGLMFALLTLACNLGSALEPGVTKSSPSTAAPGITSTQPPPAGDGPAPMANPFESLTPEQEACLREAWGDEAFDEIATFQRPPSPEEVPVMGQCEIAPPGSGAPGEQPMPGGEGGSPPEFNPFEALTPEQEACLRETWGDEAFEEISTFQRPPSFDEAPAMGQCGIAPPGGQGPSGQPPPEGAPGEQPPPEGAGGQPPVEPIAPSLEGVALNVTGAYLMAFTVCDSAAVGNCGPQTHSAYLAQSDDGATWSVVPGWEPIPGSVPDVIRRGNTLYIYTPNKVTRYHLDSNTFDPPTEVTVSGLEAGGFVDPSLILDDQGRLVLFFLHGRLGGDPAGCLPEDGGACEKHFGSATEVEGSDGTEFTLDDDDRATVALGGSSELQSASDPDIFSDGTQYVLYISHGPSTSVWIASELRGTYTQFGQLAQGSGGVPSGYFDRASGQYWTFAHVEKGGVSIIRRALHADFSRTLGEEDWTMVIDGASIGLTATTEVGSPGFAVNQP